VSTAVRAHPGDSRTPEGPSPWGRFDPLVLVTAAVALVTFLLHGWDGVLSRDLSLYSYAGQTVADGVPPYVGVLNRAGPLAHLLPAIGVLVARTYGGDEVHAMRVFYMVVSVIAVVVAYLLGRDLFRSRIAGLATAATLLSFHAFILYATGGPREKSAMLLFILCALWAAARRRWFVAGVFISLATLTLQIAFFLVFPAVLLAIGARPWREWLRKAGRVVAGGAVPVVVVAVYFVAVGALSDFLLGFLLLNARYNRGSSLLTHLDRDWASMQQGYGVSLWFFFLGLSTVVFLTVVAYRRADLRRTTPWLTFVAALGPALLVDFLWNFRDFDSWADAIPVLPVAAVGIGALARLLQERLSRRTGTAITAAWVAVTLLTALIYSTTFHDTRLVDQRRSVAAFLGQLPASAKVLSIEAPQPLVLTGRRNPTRYQMFTGGMENYVDHIWPGGLQGYAKYVLRTRPDIVAIDPDKTAVWGPALASGYKFVGCAPEWRWYADRRLGSKVLDDLRKVSPC